MNGWNGTAWWGFCFHCSTWFNNHEMSCPMIAPPVPSTTANPIVWRVTPISNTAAKCPEHLVHYTIHAA